MRTKNYFICFKIIKFFKMYADLLQMHYCGFLD